MTPDQFQDISSWQKQTFGKATAISKIAHLHQEVLELDDVVRQHEYGTIDLSKEKRLEFADCFLLLFGAAASDGMSYQDIVDCINEKMEINKTRKWGKPDANGVVNHIKD